MFDEPCIREPVVRHVQRLLACFRRWTGSELLAGEADVTEALARTAPVVSRILAAVP